MSENNLRKKNVLCQSDVAKALVLLGRGIIFDKKIIGWDVWFSSLCLQYVLAALPTYQWIESPAKADDATTDDHQADCKSSKDHCNDCCNCIQQMHQY